jgi:hypothetical protein
MLAALRREREELDRTRKGMDEFIEFVRRTEW